MTSLASETVLEAPTIGTFNSNHVTGLIQQVARSEGIGLTSCLDVGCGLRPMNSWFSKYAQKYHDETNPRFICSETDPEMLAKLREMGMEAENPYDCVRDVKCDLVIAKEVIEHIKSADTPAFLDFCARNTRRIFALTTPNFEYWDNLNPVDPSLRWIPEHFRCFHENSENPHHHKQEMTPANVLAYLQRAFPAGSKIQVYRAWPWLFRDLARELEWTLYFKIFAIVQVT